MDFEELAGPKEGSHNVLPQIHHELNTPCRPADAGNDDDDVTEVTWPTFVWPAGVSAHTRSCKMARPVSTLASLTAAAARREHCPCAPTSPANVHSH